jgi:hypothetical protein
MRRARPVKDRFAPRIPIDKWAALGGSWRCTNRLNLRPVSDYSCGRGYYPRRGLCGLLTLSGIGVCSAADEDDLRKGQSSFKPAE